MNADKTEPVGFPAVFRDVPFEYEQRASRADGREVNKASSGRCALFLFQDRFEYITLPPSWLPGRSLVWKIGVLRRRVYYKELYDMLHEEKENGSLLFVVRKERNPEEGTPQFGFTLVYSEETIEFHIGRKESAEWYFRIKDLWKGTSAERLYKGEPA